METPSYIKSLLKPNGSKPQGRKVWSVDLETVWLPFFTATNTTGDTQITPDALGAPIRLAYNQDGSVKFSKSGRPVTTVAKELALNVRLVRENFTAGLQAYANAVITENSEGYRAMVEMARKAGNPIIANDRRKLDDALLRQMEEAINEASATSSGQASSGSSLDSVRDKSERAEAQEGEGDIPTRSGKGKKEKVAVTA